MNREWILSLSSLPILLACVLPAKGARTPSEQLLPGGSYVPFFSPLPREPKASSVSEPIRKPVSVPSFWMDTRPVTLGEYLEFLRKSPEWRRSKIARVFADDSYLKNWRGDLELPRHSVPNQPVVQISWFAAAAYCHSQGKELPTTDQWEYAIEDAGKNSEILRAQILAWYSAPNPARLASVQQKPANIYGIYDLHGLVWEWTLDFNSSMIGAELRSDGTKDDNLFCGAGSLSARDSADYPRFMRYSFRGSLKASYTTANLGFRCAREKTP